MSTSTRMVDRLIVPVTFAIAVLLTMAVTVSWVPRPLDALHWDLRMGPPGLTPGRYYGLRFTPRNVLSGHTVMRMVPAQGRCIPLTVTNTSLTYLDQQWVCRLRDGSYKHPYRFPYPDDYVVFVEMHPVGAGLTAYRLAVPLDLCTLGRRRRCRWPQAHVRGLENERSHTVDGLTVVLGAPVQPVQAGQPVGLTLIFLRHGRTALDVASDGDAVAISMDTRHFTRLHLANGQAPDRGGNSGGLLYTGVFDRPSIYRVFVTVRYARHPVRTSFVIDVNPPPPLKKPVGD